MADKPEAKLFKTDRGVFRLFAQGDVGRDGDRQHVMDVHRGRCYEFASEADALAWIETGKPDPLPMRDPTAEEIAEFERIEAEVDELYGPDDGLADL